MELNYYDYHCFQLKIILIFFLANVPTKEDHLKAIVLLGEYYNISLIVEFQRWWVLKCKIHLRKKSKKIPTGNVSSSKIGHLFRQ